METEYSNFASFEQLKTTTQCPFAKNAEVLKILPRETNIVGICDQLQSDLPHVTENKVDTTVVNLPSEYVQSIDKVGDALREILLTLNNQSLNNIESKEWRLYLYNQKFFVAAFWEGFDDINPRKCNKGALLLFQPKSSFERGGLQGGINEVRIRSRINTIFTNGGKSYDHSPLIEAERFLPGTKWWEART